MQRGRQESVWKGDYRWNEMLCPPPGCSTNLKLSVDKPNLPEAGKKERSADAGKMRQTSARV